MSHNDREIEGLHVHINPSLCIGAGSCLAFAPTVFQLDEDNKVFFLDGAVETTQDELLNAARSCPTAAIIIKNQEGKIVAP